MENSEKKVNREVLLPYGEKLKPLLNSNTMQSSELKSILNERGIFVTDNNKEKTIPIITKILLTPKEFERIIETQKTKDACLILNDVKLALETAKKDQL